MSSLHDTLKGKVEFGLAACIGCNECMAACPVAPSGLSIARLNYETGRAMAGTSEKLPVDVSRFVTECFQCGACVPVCPAGLERDAMVLYQKSALKTPPPEYLDNLKLKGAGQSVGRELGITVHNLKHRGRLGPLAQHVDKRELGSADTLFFFGCNIFSETKVAEKVLVLADYLGCDYEVLGGMRSCCGWPHYLAGEMDRAETLMDHLFARIMQVAPKEVVTVGAECYAALRRLEAIQGDLFTTVTAASWIRRNLHRFPVERMAATMTFHDACHVTRKLGEGEEVRRVLRQMGNFVEMEKDGPTCCGYHQFEVNPKQLEGLRQKRLESARAVGADMMVVECVRCLESFAPVGKKMDMPVVDLIDLIYDAVQDDTRPAPQPVHFKSPRVSKGAAPAEGA